MVHYAVAGRCPSESSLQTILWIARFDTDEANVAAAEHLFRLANASLPKGLVQHIATAISHQNNDVREAAAAALSAGIAVSVHTFLSEPCNCIARLWLLCLSVWIKCIDSNLRCAKDAVIELMHACRRPTLKCQARL